MRTCLSIIGSGILLVALAVGIWVKRDEVADFLNRLNGDEIPTIEAAGGAASAGGTVSPEATGPGADLARGVERKIISLGQGRESEIVLTPDELNAWIAHGLKGYFPAYVSDVSAGLEDDERLVLRGRVAMASVPGLEDLDQVARFVGDTAAVQVKGRLDGIAPGRGIYFVEGAQVGPLPLPEPVAHDLIARLRRGAPSDTLPAGALEFELPPFVTDIAIRGGGVHMRGCGRATC